MAVHKTYAEAVKQSGNVKHIFTDDKFFYTDGSDSRVAAVTPCQPKDHLTTLTQFHAAGHDLVVGDSISDERGNVILLDNQEDVNNWNEPDEGDYEIFVIEAATLKGPTPVDNAYLLNIVRDVDKMIEDGKKTVRLRTETAKLLLEEVIESRGLSMPVYHPAQFDAPWKAAKAVAHDAIVYRKDGDEYKRVETEQEACSFWDELFYE